MEALGALAAAERHIRALSTARADSGRSGDFTRFARREPASRVVPPRSASGAWRHARLALPVRQGRSLWGRLPSVERRDSLSNVHSPGGLKGRGPLAANGVSGVACAGPILASAARCCCSSENIPHSDRQRPEGFQRTMLSAVLSADRLSSTVPRTETDGNAIPCIEQLSEQSFDIRWFRRSPLTTCGRRTADRGRDPTRCIRPDRNLHFGSPTTEPL